MGIGAEEYPGRPRADARRSLDGEPCNVEDTERTAAAAAAAQHYYYASQQQQQQQHQQAPPSAFEWQELAANLGQISVGGAAAQYQYQVRLHYELIQRILVL